ncbi:MAG: hypothetical protein ACSLFI_11250 [Solirubrobacterales bacterium]
MDPFSLRDRLREQVPGAVATAIAMVVWTLLLRHVSSLDPPWNVILGVGELLLTAVLVHFALAWLRPFPQFDVQLSRLRDPQDTRGDALAGQDVRLTPNPKGSVWLLGQVRYREQGWVASRMARHLWKNDLQLTVRFTPATRPTMVIERCSGVRWDAVSSATGAELRSESLHRQTGSCEMGTFRCELRVDRSLGPVNLQCDTEVVGLAGSKLRLVTRARCELRSIIVED